MRRAVIDIGTNTVKLLVADVLDGHVVPVLAKDVTTRLGEGLERSCRLSPAAMARTVAAIQDFAGEAHELGVTQVLAVTTSAAREAENRQEFLDAVRRACGLEVRTISGEEEAAWIFRGVASDPVWANVPLLVLDVGGGSAEFIQGTGGIIDRHQSLALGAVRLMERFGQDDFAGMIGFLREEFVRRLAGYGVEGRRMIGTGGGITTVARMTHGKADHARLTLDEIRALVAHLNALLLAERKRVPGLPPERADIIVAGGAVFVAAMESLGAVELTVSVRNLRYGALVSGMV